MCIKFVTHSVSQSWVKPCLFLLKPQEPQRKIYKIQNICF